MLSSLTASDRVADQCVLALIFVGGFDLGDDGATAGINIFCHFNNVRLLDKNRLQRKKHQC